MPGALVNGVQGAGGNAAGPTLPAGNGREIGDEEKQLAASLMKRIQAAKDRHKDQIKQFTINRALLRGKGRDGKKIRENLFFANLATMRPQVYAKDPEFAIKPSASVSDAQLEPVKLFATTAQVVLTKVLVKDARLKQRAKRILTSAYTTGVGWFKCSWQDGRSKTNPLIENRLKDTQDNLARLQALRDQLSDPQSCSDVDLQTAKLREMLAGLQAQAEVVVERGLALDFVKSEDVLCLDVSVMEFSDYLRSSALAHGRWITREGYQTEFGHKSEKGRSYSEVTPGGMMKEDGTGDGKDSGGLLRVWEVWDQDSNRVYTLCEGEEGFCRAPFSPEWTGQRWYPFFGLAFNEIEGAFYPISDVELTEAQVEDINEAQADFRRDRKAALPVNLVRKGGALTDKDVRRISERQGSEMIPVEGIPGRPINDDVFIGQLIKLARENYDTQAARGFMEMIVGGGDAARGAVMDAKTATEAEILSQGLRGRSAERQDSMEDLISEMGTYALQVLLRKLTPQEVKRIAGEQAEWPQLTVDDVFEMIELEVRAGSTGKPDRLQEQDRWTKLLPQIKETLQQVAELRAQGEEHLAQTLIELLRETLRRFEERLDIDSYFPKPKEGEAPQGANPGAAAKLDEAMKMVAQLQEELKAAKADKEKAERDAAVKLATAAQPGTAIAAFGAAMQAIEAPANAMPPEAAEALDPMPENGGEMPDEPAETQPVQEQQVPPMSGPQTPPTAGEMP